MAAAAVLSAMPGHEATSVHPFFRPANGTRPANGSDRDGVANAEIIDLDHLSDVGAQLDGVQDKPTKPRSSRKSVKPAIPEVVGKKQRTLQSLVAGNVGAGQPPNGHVNQATDAVSSDPVIFHKRRKRRRTSENEYIEAGAEEQIEDAAPCVPRAHSPRVVIPSSPPRSEFIRVSSDEPTDNVTKTPPKKVLRLNANGKFSSPVSKKTKQDTGGQPSPEAPRRRGRPRKSKDTAGPKQLLVSMSYGRDANVRATLGSRIDRILAGDEKIALTTTKKASPKKLRTPKKPAKDTHPFFLGKPKEQQTELKQASPRKTATTTPGKLKMQVFSDRLHEVKEVPYGSTLLKDRLMVKHPGATDPPWPNAEQTHVRGLENSARAQAPSLELTFHQRKRKKAQRPVPSQDSVLSRFAADLKPDIDRPIRDDGFLQPDAALRLPTKLLISGHDIRERIAPELSVSLHDDAADELSLPTSSQLSAHPALQNLWRRTSSHLTAFDESRGETNPWTNKYAPSTAVTVLQPDREMRVIRDWMTSLTVSAVEGTGHNHSKAVVKAEPKPKKKRRRKHDDMDGFLVDSDEDVPAAMNELISSDDLGVLTESRSHKSVIQLATEGAKLSNAVLLSGPHGCGKTAAAFAVAKELGFKVFEIGPHERRSGKDVLDKVGNMTENHLVKHHGPEPGEVSSAEEPSTAQIDEAFQHDLATGRQGKMNAFFKPKTTSKQPAAKSKATAKVKTLEAIQKVIRKPPQKEQQQSLILLEEVDILFKDDKEFWMTVLKLITTSKRPFIMTCNDEDLVPHQAMSLHAILRFSPPPLDLAVDYMLLVAAAEGHILQRSAVSSLYDSKRRDLRASMTELNFWCQMGVGDPRGGLSWIYQRWPEGSDLDEQGRKLRFVSSGTYQKGMGLSLGDDLSEEYRALWTWREFGVDPLDTLAASTELNPSGAVTEEASSEHRQRSAALKAYAAVAEAMSSVDAFSSIGLSDTAPLDTTQPLLSDKARNHYVEGLPLLQADPRKDYTELSMQLVATSACKLARVLRRSRHGREDLLGTRPMDGEDFGQAADRPHFLTRTDFACFDAVSAPSDAGPSTSTGFSPSAFDGPLTPIATDLAPYIRLIVQYDIALEEQRERLNMLMANGDSRRAKRARTTRAARSALEGSQRASTRRERWFTKDLDMTAVLATGGSTWPKAEVARPETASADGSEAVASSAEAV